jgi:hypothetical protein
MEEREPSQPKLQFNLALSALVAAAIALYGIFAPWVSFGITSVSGNRSNEGIFPLGVCLTLAIFGLTWLIPTLKHLCKASTWLLIIGSGWSLSSYYEWYHKVTASISGYKSSLNNDQLNSLGILGKDFTQSLQSLTNSLKPNFAVGFWISIVVALVGLMLGAISLWGEKQSEEQLQKANDEIPELSDANMINPEVTSKRVSKSIFILPALVVIGLSITFGVNIWSSHKTPKTQVADSSTTASASPVAIPSGYYQQDSVFSYKLLDYPSSSACNSDTTFCFHISLISQSACSKEYRFTVRFFTPTDLKKAFALVDFSLKPDDGLAIGVPHDIQGTIDYKAISSTLDAKTLAKDWASQYHYQIETVSCA